MKKFKNIVKKRVPEMSRYINIPNYDKYEEQHIFYLEMLEAMLSKIDKNRNIRILEIGAGTGLFTKRLAKLDNAQITAVERDDECFEILNKKMESFSNVTLFYGDAVVYNEPVKFDYIVSAFSDHHIQPVDKLAYLLNVKENLNDNGLFLVGDEFLREFEENDARFDEICALHDWHGHVIKIALAKKQVQLAEMEYDALVSGIKQKGDFKTSLKIYESYLEAAGLNFTRALIGPHDIQKIGGINVYTVWK